MEASVKAYYQGRNDFWNGFKPDASATGNEAFEKDYARGYRDVRAEDGLDRDTEWDSDEGY